MMRKKQKQKPSLNAASVDWGSMLECDCDEWLWGWTNSNTVPPDDTAQNGAETEVNFSLALSQVS